MNKKLVSFAVALGLVFTVNISVSADPLSQQLQNEKKQLQSNKSALKSVQDKRQSLTTSIEMLDNQIETTMSQIDSTKKQIDVVQGQILITEKDVQATEKDIQSERDLFGKRLKAIYINGTNGYISAILEAKGFRDLVSRIEAVTKIAQLDKKIVTNLKNKETELNNKKLALNNEQTKLVTLKADNEKKLVKLNEDKKDQSKLIADLKVQEIAFASKVSSSQSKVNATMKQIAEIRRNAPSVSVSRGTMTPATSNNVIAYATNFLGRPYRWGGTGPDRFDCSGFTQYVYSHFGISVGRTTYDQINRGVAVSRDELQPGDLVFFGSWGNPHHVGIYAGNGTYIHSPQTGDVIKISDMSRSDYLTARRVK